MPQPIEEGTVLGGRYRVTGHVVTSADQDMVLEGRDQVLNRDVTILVAASQHASQVATSARELATGERTGDVQVLDLGLSDGRTYLIASGDSPAQGLLDLAQAQQVYVEPFYTDTLGSELFGESRTYEPHVYEDDDEYYSDLDAPAPEEESTQRRPKFLNRISEQLNRRLGTSEGTAAAAGAAGAGAAAAAPHDGPDTDEHQLTGGAPQRRYDEEFPLPDQVEDDFDLGATQAHQTVPQPEEPRQQDHSSKVTVWEDEPEDTTGLPDDDATAISEPHHEPATEAHHRSDEFVDDPEQEWDHESEPASDRGFGDSVAQEADPEAPTEDDDRGAGAAGLAAGGAALAAGAASGSGSGRSSWREFLSGGSSSERTAQSEPGPAADPEDHPAPAAPVEEHRPVDRVDDADEEFEYAEDEDRDRPGAARWLMAGILALLLVLAAVFAFNLLNKNVAPTAGPTDGAAQGTESASPSASEQAPSSTLPSPAIAGVSRLVPDAPGLSSETDSTLRNAVDGNPATAWQTYSFAQPRFGGYASSMALVVELEETSAVNELNITQNNGTGGSFTVLVGPSENIGEATQIAEGSFTGPQISIPVGQDGAPAEAKYVFVNFTELPRLSNASSNLPYGLRVAEVKVN